MRLVVGVDPRRIFAGLRRVAGDPSTSLTRAAFALVCKWGWLSAWEAEFYAETRKRRRISPRQEEKREEINLKIIARLAREAKDAT